MIGDVVELTDHVDKGFSWREAGSGELVLFLHPIVGTRRYWDHQLRSLAQRWRCVALDAPGYGGSDQVADPLAANVTSRLIEFLDLLDVDRAQVVGLSLGGMYALHLAAHAPERVGRLVVADTSAAFGIEPEPWLEEWLAPVRRGYDLSEVAQDAIRAITHVELSPDTMSELRVAFEDVSRVGFERASLYIAQHNVRDQLALMGNRTLVLVGRHDEETPLAYSEEIASVMPNASLQVLDGVGHLTSIEAPELFSQIVHDALSA